MAQTRSKHTFCLAFLLYLLDKGKLIPPGLEIGLCGRLGSRVGNHGRAVEGRRWCKWRNGWSCVDDGDGVAAMFSLEDGQYFVWGTVSQYKSWASRLPDAATKKQFVSDVKVRT